MSDRVKQNKPTRPLWAPNGVGWSAAMECGGDAWQGRLKKYYPQAWRFFLSRLYTLASMFLWNKGSDWRIPFYLRCFFAEHQINVYTAEKNIPKNTRSGFGGFRGNGGFVNYELRNLGYSLPQFPLNPLYPHLWVYGDFLYIFLYLSCAKWFISPLCTNLAMCFSAVLSGMFNNFATVK